MIAVFQFTLFTNVSYCQSTANIILYIILYYKDTVCVFKSFVTEAVII